MTAFEDENCIEKPEEPGIPTSTTPSVEVYTVLKLLLRLVAAIELGSPHADWSYVVRSPFCHPQPGVPSVHVGVAPMFCVSHAWSATLPSTGNENPPTTTVVPLPAPVAQFVIFPPVAPPS